ncbi:hypothetical protein EQH57_0204, partial [Dictyocoela roeselum]
QSINQCVKSFIINNLIYNSPLETHLNLSSNRTLQELKYEIRNEEYSFTKTKKVNDEYEVALFEYKSELSGLKICHKLNILTSIENQDLLSWKICFNEVSRICRWSEEAKLEVLTQIVDLSIQHQIGNFNTSEEMMHKILQLKYNLNTAPIYQVRLSKIKQNDYYTIRHMWLISKKIVRKLASVLGGTNR